MIILESRAEAGLWIRLYEGHKGSKRWEYVEHHDQATRLTHANIHQKLQAHNCHVKFQTHEIPDHESRPS